MGKLLTVSTNKGGAGKTTIATNIAACLTNLNPDKKVCLLDLDGQCGVSIIYGKSPKEYINEGILSVIDSSKNLNQVILNNLQDGYKNLKTNLFFIPAEPNLQMFDHWLNQNLALENNLLQTFDFLKEQFDYVVVDTPNIISSLNVMTYLKSDLIVSPFEPERQNIEGSFKIINEMKKPLYKNNPFIYMVPIKVKERTLIDRDLMEYVQTVLTLENNPKVILSSLKIPNSTQYKSTTAKERVPLIDSKGKSKALLAHKQLINELTLEIMKILE